MNLQGINLPGIKNGRICPYCMAFWLLVIAVVVTYWRRTH